MYFESLVERNVRVTMSADIECPLKSIHESGLLTTTEKALGGCVRNNFQSEEMNPLP